ncbi:MAG: HEPN domain-containing protein [Desulfurococcus sp.]|nr:HEPN domain-containing protein [Desulfurococcus sp.]
MSGSYPRLLKRRAEAMLRNAIRLLEEGEYDLAVLNAEYAAQLYVKAVLYQLTGDEWRGHSIRSLVGVPAYAARENGLDQLADKIFDFIRRNRRILAELDEAHVRAVYGVFEYTRSRAEAILDSSRQVVNLVREIDRNRILE